MTDPFPPHWRGERAAKVACVRTIFCPENKNSADTARVNVCEKHTARGPNGKAFLLKTRRDLFPSGNGSLLARMQSIMCLEQQLYCHSRSVKT